MIRDCEPGCVEHYACRLRGKGLQVSPRATPTKTLNWRPTPFEPPSINAKIIYDERPDGSKMPLMNPDKTVVRHKQYREHEHKIEAICRNFANSNNLE